MFFWNVNQKHIDFNRWFLSNFLQKANWTIVMDFLELEFIKFFLRLSCHFTTMSADVHLVAVMDVHILFESHGVWINFVVGVCDYWREVKFSPVSFGINRFYFQNLNVNCFWLRKEAEEPINPLLWLQIQIFISLAQWTQEEIMERKRYVLLIL